MPEILRLDDRAGPDPRSSSPDAPSELTGVCRPAPHRSVILFAHRGASASAPENTIAAFELALELGATGLESDVWLTADGVAVLDHDGFADDGHLVPISAVAASELPPHIPTLAELYDIDGARSVELSLDVKDLAAVDEVVRVAERLKLVLPITIFIIFLLLYFNTRSVVKTLIVFLAVPFSAIGAVWFLYALDYNLSIAVWVGLIALLGVDAETGVFMLLYLDLAYDERRNKGLMTTKAHLHDAIIHGAVKRLRPKFMTVAVDFIGLVPVMWAVGAGSDVMKRIAAPMIAGVFTSFVMELVVYPAIYAQWKWHFEVKRQPAAEPVLAS